MNDDILMQQELKLMKDKVAILNHINSGKLTKDELTELATTYVNSAFNLLATNQKLQLEVTRLTHDNIYHQSLIGVVYYVPQ